MTGDDFALTAGWGHVGAGDAIMPGQGRTAECAFTPDERIALSEDLPVLGKATFDVYLNDRAFWPPIHRRGASSWEGGFGLRVPAGYPMYPA